MKFWDRIYKRFYSMQPLEIGGSKGPGPERSVDPPPRYLPQGMEIWGAPVLAGGAKGPGPERSVGRDPRKASLPSMY